ncbi:MAG: TRAP transporter small permease [Desulfobacterota bacterium]|nr:TRAP transporter small permease [Thermodesulfobacteriota bacterium]MDW8001542.1 TRAP transporter small permease subunit [Deltaproteobacteria bacterium]
MTTFKDFSSTVSRYMYVISGACLSFMVILTLIDVILRNFGYPITGSMEIIQYGGCIVFSFAVPYGTLLGAQVLVDLVIERIDPRKKRVITIITRIIGVILFLFIAYNFFIYGFDVKRSGERTASFRIPYYPFAFALSFSFFIQSLVIFSDLIERIKTKGEKR